MRKTAEWTKGAAPRHTEDARLAVYLQCWSSRSSWRKVSFWDSLFLILLHQQHTNRLCVCVCWSAYLNIPHPKCCKPCLYKSERGREREEEIWQGTGQKERGGGGGGKEEERKISLLCSCCHRNPPDNTYSFCHSGMEDSEWIKPSFYSSIHWPCETTSASTPTFVSSQGTWKRE